MRLYFRRNLKRKEYGLLLLLSLVLRLKCAESSHESAEHMSTEKKENQYISLQRDTDIIATKCTMENASTLVPWDVTFSLWTRTRVQDRLVLASDGDYQFSPYLFTENALNAFQAGGQIYTATTSIEVTEEWHHYVSVVDRTNMEIQWYFDGEHLESITMNDDYNGNPTFGPDTINNAIIFGRFARWSDDGQYLLRMWPFAGIYGHLDEVSLWAKVLSAQDIAQVYQNGLSADQIRVQPESLVLCYPFDYDDAGTTVKNLGTGGKYMDAVLGGYATRTAPVGEITQVWQDETDEGCDTFVSCTKPIRINSADEHNLDGTDNLPPTVEDQDVTVVESDELTFYLYSYDDDGDWVNYTIQTLPAHGNLYEIDSFTREQHEIVKVPHPMQFVHFRLNYYPGAGRDDKTSIGFTATDEWGAISNEAYINIEVIQVDNPPETTSMTVNATEDDPLVHLQLRAIDVDSEYIQILINAMPEHGSLYSAQDLSEASRIDAAFAPWTIYEPMDQYVIDVIDVSTFWVSPSNDEYDYPYWHPFMVVGEQSVDVYGDSRLAWSPLNRAAPDNVYEDGDDLLTFGPWNPRENLETHGYSEFIEVLFETPVYVQEIIIGMPRGMGAVVAVKAWDNATAGYQTLFKDEADPDYERYMQLTNQYSYFAPHPLCETAFLTNRVRVEMDTLTVSDWNEIDYIMLRGSLKKQSSRLQCIDGLVNLWYVPDKDFSGVDTIKYQACDCGSDSCSDETTIAIDVNSVPDAPVVPEKTDIELQSCVVGERYDIELPAIDADSETESFIFVLEGIVNSTSQMVGDFELYDGDTPITSFPYKTAASTVADSTLGFARLTTTMAQASLAYYVEDSTGLRSFTGTAVIQCREETCAIGSYFDGTGCIDCPPGSYSDVVGLRFECKQCEPGTYQSESGLNSCLSCGSAEVATSEVGATECTCLPGSYRVGSVCEICGPGTYSDTINADSCKMCPRGWYTSNDDENDGSGVTFAASYCLPCPADSYSNDTSSALCMPCPDKLTSDEGSTTCDKCVELYYYDDRDQNCIQCADVVTCVTGTTLATWDLKSGYWREDEGSRQVFECPPVSNCGGGVGLTGKDDAICMGNFGGRLCAQCESGYYLSGQNCSLCKGNYTTLVRITLGILLVLICALFLFLSGTPAFITELYEAQRQARLRRASKCSSSGSTLPSQSSTAQANGGHRQVQRRRSSFQAAINMVQITEAPDENPGRRLRRLSRSLSEARIAWRGKIDPDDDDDEEDEKRSPGAIAPLNNGQYRTRKRVGAPPSAEYTIEEEDECPESPGSPTALLSGSEFNDSAANQFTVSSRPRKKHSLPSFPPPPPTNSEIELRDTSSKKINQLPSCNTYDRTMSDEANEDAHALTRPKGTTAPPLFSVLQDVDDSELDEFNDADDDGEPVYPTNNRIVSIDKSLKKQNSNKSVNSSDDDDNEQEKEKAASPSQKQVIKSENFRPARGQFDDDEDDDDLSEKERNDKKEAEASVALIRLYSMLNVKWKILVSAFQILASNSQSFRMDWPVAFGHIIELLMAFNVDFFVIPQVNCLQRLTHYDRLLMSTVLPLFLISFIGIIVITPLDAIARSRRCTKYNQQHSRIALAIIIVFLFYSSASRTIAVTFVCQDLGSKSYLRADLNLRCEGRNYQFWYYYSVVMSLIWPIGMPLLFFILCWRNRRRIQPHDFSKREVSRKKKDREVAKALAVRQFDPTIHPLKVLWIPYEPEFWYWESVDTIKRMMLTFLAQLVKPGTPVQVLYCLCVSIGFLRIQAYFNPYCQDQDDILAESLMWMLIFFYTQVMINMLGFIQGVAIDIMLCATLIAAVLGAVGLVVSDIQRELSFVRVLRSAIKRSLTDRKGSVVSFNQRKAVTLQLEAAREAVDIATNEAEAIENNTQQHHQHHTNTTQLSRPPANNQEQQDQSQVANFGFGDWA